MSSGTFYEGPLTITGSTLSVGSTTGEQGDVVDASKWFMPDDAVTVMSPRIICPADEHQADQDRRITILEQLVADQGMMLAQLREIVQGEPPFLTPEGDWHPNE